MTRKLNIKSAVVIQNQKVFLNDNLIFENSEAEDFSAFAKSYYQHSDIQYPKFYKMDRLSKLGFLAFETLLKGVPDFENFDKEKVGIFLMNRHSSLDTDEQYYETFLDKNRPPSPKLFVYTLPNIVIGEICIRHKIKGEHGFFVGEQYDEDFINDYVQSLFEDDLIEACAVGWTDFYKEDYFAKMYWLA